MPQNLSHLQRSVCYWIQDEDEQNRLSSEEEEEDGGGLHSSKHHSTIETEEVVTKYGVPQDIFVKYMRKEIDSTESCLSLPFTLLLVISYAMVAISHDSAEMVNAVEDSISHDITENANFAFSDNMIMGFKNFEDVNTHADFWSWMDRGFLPLIWAQAYNLAEGRNWSEPYVQQASRHYTRAERGVLLHYNRIVMGVRLSQERDEGKCQYDVSGDCKKADRKCAFDPLVKLYDKDCVGGLGHELEPEVMDARKTTNPTRIHWLYINDEAEYIRQQLVNMERSGWLDEKTRKIEIAMPIYNAEYGLHTMFLCCFFFSRGGHIWKEIIPLSAFAQNWNSFRSMFYDAVWMLCLLYVIVVEGLEVLGVIHEHGAGGLVSHYLGFWNGVDWISVMAGFGIIAMFFTNFQGISSMNDGLTKLGDINEYSERSKWREQGRIYMDALEAEVHFAFTFRIMQAAYPGVIFLRLFKAFGAQPRLAVVTGTLEHSWIDLVHFLLIFCSVFFTYMIAGVVLFGREVNMFTTVFRSFITCFRATFGDFDWEELRSVGRVDAFLWFLPFMILIVLILLNMLIAIVMDAHAEVISGMEFEDDIITLTQKALRTKSGKWKKANVPHPDVLKGVEEKMREDEKRKKESDYGHDLSEDVDSDSEEEEFSAKKSKKKKKKKDKAKEKKLAQSIGVNEMVTVTLLKQLFPTKMKTPQARELIREAILFHYSSNRRAGDIKEASQAIAMIDYRIRQLRDVFNARMSSDGLAVNNGDKVAEVANECHMEADAAREDLADWLPEDEDDIRLPVHWLRPPTVAAPAAIATAAGDDMVSNSRNGPGLLNMVKHMKGHEGAGNQVELTVGSFAQLLADEALVLKACRDAGIASTYDHLRRQAVGRMVQIIARDDDGTVQCSVPRVGDLWFAKTAFSPTMRGAGDLGAAQGGLPSELDNETEALENRVRSLEGEVVHGKEVVEECLEALKTLHEDLMKMKAEKRKGVEKFNQYRHQAVALQRGNVAEKERFKDCQQSVKQATTERDNLFERVKNLAKENRELEELLAAKQREMPLPIRH